MDDTARLADAREALLSAADPIDRTERVPLSVAAGRVLSAPATAAEDVPHADVAAGETLLSADRRLGPADLTLLKAAGVDECAVRRRPEIGVVPVGDDLVQRDPGPDERVEVTGFGLSQYVEGWGGDPTYRNVVGEQRPSLRAAVQRDLTRDALAIAGVDRESAVREVVADLGEVRVADVACSPGSPVTVGVVEGRPVLLLPDAPVDCLAAAVQLLRPLVARLAGAPLPDPPSQRATLDDAVESPDGVRTFVPARVSDGTASPVATDPTLRDVARADGWVTLSEDVTRLDGGASVTVRDWEA
ncbi:molybdopterin-binding protein [Halomicrobium salinisoli]|uniref:molybdopterin-binding protein n=1 Tax=Halomicrobium salinisoli TaxID=2878391 RepID=UPI001CF002E6|nr:molybdopterin-binding protein [Halomicrobium salinisoli]